jgi:glycosyltransferase involved in cell wall biosynthesis
LLMFTATLGYGGAESSFMRLAEYLAQYMDVTIALMARDYGSSDYSAAQSQTDLPLVVLDDAQPLRDNYLSKALRWWRMLRRLRGLKRQHDVTISFLSGPNLLNALAGRSDATIVSERGSKLYHVGIPPRTKWLWLRILDPLTYTLSRIIVPGSKGYAEEIAEIAGPRLAHKIEPIEGGIDADALIANTEALVDKDILQFCASPTAVYCGRLDHGKGIDLLIPIFARVYRQNPAVRLLVIGDGPLRATLIDLCAVEGLSVTDDGDPTVAVFFAGYRRDPMRHFRLCQVFCFPSLHEGLGNALIEGVASGIPVLAADCPWGPRSILTGAQDADALLGGKPPLVLAHGTLMPLPDTPDGAGSWVAALSSALEAPGHRRLPESCRSAIARFDLQVTGLQWVKLISSLNGLSSGSRGSSRTLNKESLP